MIYHSPLPQLARRIRLGGTPGVIAGLLFGAAPCLPIRPPRTHRVQPILDQELLQCALVQWLCTASLSVSLTQLIRWLICRRLFTILQLNHFFGLSNPFRILRPASCRRVRNAIPAIIIAALLQAFALVSILAPNSLEVGSASPQNTTISVPTVYFSETNLSEVQCDPYPSAAWQKVLGQALQSDTLLSWNAPAG
ncbi:uncharacterized protein ARMOST_18656 [Armillaria ostoyae]|uniref:Uncharacterized protein n=1 Tax=Armillaria ostoyae TaxID=47428 RepID=A0A284S2C3_ARMOS|nr:uncharacterized protein ARMOST_18656 [Armillaria ostoyae]